MSENRALALLELLAHLADEIPDKYVLGGADIPPDIEISTVSGNDLPIGWKNAVSARQTVTRQIGDEWASRARSAVLSVPSVIVEERNFVLNPAHPDFKRIAFLVTTPFEFDARFFDERTPW
jgi:RES domain-containing protein